MLVTVKMLRDVPARGLRAGEVREVRAPVAYTMCRRGDAEAVEAVKVEASPDPVALVAPAEPPPAVAEPVPPAPLPGPHAPLAQALVDHARQFAEESRPDHAEQPKLERTERHEKKRRR